LPQTELVFYQEAPGQVPVLEWLKDLRRGDSKAYSKCVAIIERLAAYGHELRRPAADFLRDGIYELRAKQGRVNYRILYFFDGQNTVILAHALTKTDKVPHADLERALRRKIIFENSPQLHSYAEEVTDAED